MKRPRAVVTIGNFDGVHVGHAALVRRAREMADGAGENARVVAMVFEPHPLSVLRPEAAPARLTTFERRTELLGALGVDEVVRLEPTGSFLGQSPAEFVGHVVTELAPVAIVEGPDFRFGRGRAGDIAALTEFGARLGFQVAVVSPAVEVVLSDHSVIGASSSMARWLLEHGRVADAGAVLGRPYEMTGTVVPGDRRGREIGYPTANVQSECLAPADGVYSGVAVLPDGRRFPAAISVGTKPTFGANARAMEAFLILDGAPASGVWRAIDGLPEYDWQIRLEFRHWLRDQVRFGSLPDLLEQVSRDVARVRELETPMESSR